MCEVDVLRSGIGPISNNVGLIGNEFCPKLNKVGTIESGFGTTCNKVDTIKYPHQTKRALSRPNLNENWAKGALSEFNLGQNLTKWALSEPKSGQVGIIGGGSGPRVDSAWKIAKLCGRGTYKKKKWPYCVGRVIVDVTTPTPYGYFFRKYQPLPHHMATLAKMSTLSYSKIGRNCVTVDKIKGSSGQLRVSSSNEANKF